MGNCVGGDSRNTDPATNPVEATQSINAMVYELTQSSPLGRSYDASPAKIMENFLLYGTEYKFKNDTARNRYIY